MSFSLVAIVFAALIAGCGSDGNDASAGGDGAGQADAVEADTTMTTASPPLTEPQFVKEVNKLCRQAWVTILDNWDIYSRTQDPSPSEKARFIKAVKESLTAGITFHIFDGIYQLGAPRGEEQAIEEIIGPMQFATERVWKNEVSPSSVAQITELYGEYNERARQYGLDDCLVDKAHLQGIET